MEQGVFGIPCPRGTKAASCGGHLTYIENPARYACTRCGLKFSTAEVDAIQKARARKVT